QIKRFINQDILTGSLDNSQSLNRYSYVQGNPVSYTDPFGLSPVNGLFTGTNNIHTTLAVLGFTPGPGGVVADLLDAGIYLVEGDLSGTALAVLAVFCGSVALTGKAAKAGKAMNKANKLSNTSQLVNKASDMMSAGNSFMRAAMNGSDVTQVVKAAKQGRVIDKLKSAVTSAGNKFKSSKLYLNNIGAVDTRILNPSKWDDVVMDGGVLGKTSYGKSSSFSPKPDTTRINLANGRTRFTPLRKSGNPVSAGMNHVIDGHFNRSLGQNRSVFSISVEHLKEILQRKRTISSPIIDLGDGQYMRIVDTGEIIGNASLKYDGVPTSWINVLTDVKGNLITTYPVPKP
ncbi:MAG: hypothetical protein IKK33_14635, partial [Lachnospiraceae bacterium]|nr:hypothetical protein [Lachnospiraceae bacterium]